MNPLQLLPAKVRLVAYALYGVLALAATSVGAGYSALERNYPDWLVAGGAALLPFGAAFAAVATTNVYRKQAENTAIVQAPADVAIREMQPVDPGPQLNGNDLS